MKNQSITLAIYTMSNGSVGLSVNKEEFDQYLDSINKYQNKPITCNKTEKKYSHVKNNELLGALKEYFKDKTTMIVDSDSNIKTISDIELMILKTNLQMSKKCFDYENALLFLESNNLLEIFLNHKLESNIVDYYREYSRTFGQRVSINNTKKTIKSLKDIDNYIKNSTLVSEEKIEDVYDYTRETKVISLSYENYHVYLENNQEWINKLFLESNNKRGFPFAEGKVFEQSFLDLLKLQNNKTTKKNSSW